MKLFYIAAGANAQGMTDGPGKLLEGAGLLSADSAAMSGNGLNGWPYPFQ